MKQTPNKFKTVKDYLQNILKRETIFQYTTIFKVFGIQKYALINLC